TRIERVAGESYRESRLVNVRSLELPAAHNSIDELMGIREEPLAPAKWQLVKAAHGKPVRDVLIRDHLGRLRIGSIQIFSLLGPLRTGISELQPVAMRETFLQAELAGVIPALAVVVRSVDSAELWERNEQARARDGATRIRYQSIPEWV